MSKDNLKECIGLCKSSVIRHNISVEKENSVEDIINNFSNSSEEAISDTQNDSEKFFSSEVSSVSGYDISLNLRDIFSKTEDNEETQKDNCSDIVNQNGIEIFKNNSNTRLPSVKSKSDILLRSSTIKNISPASLSDKNLSKNSIFQLMKDNVLTSHIKEQCSDINCYESLHFKAFDHEEEKILQSAEFNELNDEFSSYNVENESSYLEISEIPIIDYNKDMIKTKNKCKSISSKTINNPEAFFVHEARHLNDTSFGKNDPLINIILEESGDHLGFSVSTPLKNVECRHDPKNFSETSCSTVSDLLLSKKTFKNKKLLPLMYSEYLIPNKSRLNQTKQRSPTFSDIDKSKLLAEIPDRCSNKVSIKLLQGKVKVLKEQLMSVIPESIANEEKVTLLEKRLKETDHEMRKLEKDVVSKQLLLEKCQLSAKEFENKVHELEKQCTSMKKEIEILKIGGKQISDNRHIIESKLKDALRENEKFRKELNNRKQAADENKIKIRETFKDNRIEKKKYEKQVGELMAIIKKQHKLIDNLKRQKMHLEAITALKITEKEFMKVVDFENDF